VLRGGYNRKERLNVWRSSYSVCGTALSTPELGVDSGYIRSLFEVRGGSMVSDTDTFVEHVDHLILMAGKRPAVWGNPLLSTTPTSMAIRELAERTEVLEEVVRGMALELRRLKNDE
jgi:hypothetical protein